MKQCLKKIAATVMVLALSLGIAGTAFSTPVSAAPKKLTTTDFEKITRTDGNCNFVNEFKKDIKDNKNTWFFHSFCGPETSLKKTSRGISIGSSRSAVIKKYGKATDKKTSKLIKSDKVEKAIYDLLLKDFDFKKGNTKTYIEYKMDKKVSDRTLILRFYLNKNKVSAVVYIAKK